MARCGGVSDRNLLGHGSSWVQTNAVYYVYDGNLVIQERDTNNLPTTTYTRGKDLSGSLQGAGGIGGLLARTAPSTIDPSMLAPAYYHADANGNITMLINSDQAIVAQYLYDAFGNVLSESGLLAGANLYRFSSKEAHLNSGLVYYLYRYYDANLQRWPNRDLWLDQKASPRLFSLDELFWLLGKQPPGYANLFDFVQNDPVNALDAFGLMPSGRAGGPGNYGPPTGQCPCGMHMGFDTDCASDKWDALNGGFWGWGVQYVGYGLSGVTGGLSGAILGGWDLGTYIGSALGCHHCIPN